MVLNSSSSTAGDTMPYKTIPSHSGSRYCALAESSYEDIFIIPLRPIRIFKPTAIDTACMTMMIQLKYAPCNLSFL